MSRWPPPHRALSEHEAAARCNALEIERMNANLALAAARNALRVLSKATRNYLVATGEQPDIDASEPCEMEQRKALAQALDQAGALLESRRWGK